MLHITKEKIESTVFIQKRGWWWKGIIRNNLGAIIVDFNMYIEESANTPGGYKFRSCQIDDFNAPGRYYRINTLTPTQDIWYVSAVDPSKIDYRVGD